MTPLVIVPARAGSRGVPGKNFRPLPDGTTLWGRAVNIGRQIGRVVLTTDEPFTESGVPNFQVLQRPAGLAQDDTPMREVVEHVLAEIPGEPDQPIVLLQPTTPLRTVEQIQRCLARLKGQRDGIATVREIPRQFWRAGGPYFSTEHWPNRQAAKPKYILSGECYCWQRSVHNRTGWPWGFDGEVVTDEPYVNVDTPADWEALCQIIRDQNRQTAEPTR
jgi:CMP-N-acetylneuraminic acid synthetase